MMQEWQAWKTEPWVSEVGSDKVIIRCETKEQAALIVASREFVALVARMSTEEEYGCTAPPSEDWVSTLNELIVSARKIEEVR